MHPTVAKDLLLAEIGLISILYDTWGSGLDALEEFLGNREAISGEIWTKA